MSRVSWQSVKRPFDPQQQGRFVLILGPAKMGKTTVAARFYEHLDPARIFWISAGELDGWRAVPKSVGLDPEGIDIDELQNLGAFWQLLDSLRDGWHRLVVLDSFDGAARWAERFICAADGPRRRDRQTGIPKLDQRGFGLKLNWAVATVRDHLYPITLSGTHVLVTCGLKTLDMGNESVLVPDIEGQSALVVPRFFGDVALLRREQRQRMLVFEAQDGLAVTGSRSGFPASTTVLDFVRVMLEHEAEGSAPRKTRDSSGAGPTLSRQAGERATETRAARERPAPIEPRARDTDSEAAGGEAADHEAADHEAADHEAADHQAADHQEDGEHLKPWWRLRFPELGPDYRLQSGDFEADAAGAVGASLREALSWLNRVVESAQRLKEESRIAELGRRDIALICWAHELQRFANRNGGSEDLAAREPGRMPREPRLKNDRGSAPGPRGPASPARSTGTEASGSSSRPAGRRLSRSD